ncbi:YbaB/EbfC family nucleoid-associated protein [Alicyclobacillus fastidiosus]|uniref:Nucleoid-associated protein KKP3000_003983 n=1 Tax=Alicyclobacillus fastidiosus TaxID=392011 RepID=A0ABV5AFV0_9BACL|nr:YbaB/EbfC family nucleoid-associated protein [Alicyclobacillus fastidiosus]WEH09901.1 YbaB/EbfC family nucleoid-associated protein [Alicyclobacillus fastidiosus]
MKNMNQLMRQAKKMQEDIMKAQEALGERSVEGTAGGGAVKMVMNGHKELMSVAISPDVTDDVEMLQDLILAAFQDAHQKVTELTESEMGKYTKGMNIPGLF